jgi:hypothetical protein
VTSILKAFQELERRNLPGAPAVMAPMPPEPYLRARRALAFTLVPLVVVAVALGLLWGLMRSPQRAPAATVTADVAAVTTPARAKPPEPMAADDPATAAVVKAPPAAGSGVDEAVPWGKIQERLASSSAPAALAPPVRVELPAAPPPQRGRAGLRERTVDRPVRAAVAKPQSPAVSGAGGTSSASGEAPRIDVRAISFSPDPNLRRVTLRINDGAPLVMKEGESERDVEVQLILPDVIYVRRGGNIMSIAPTH